MAVASPCKSPMAATRVGVCTSVCVCVHKWVCVSVCVCACVLVFVQSLCLSLSFFMCLIFCFVCLDKTLLWYQHMITPFCVGRNENDPGQNVHARMCG